MSPGNYEVRAVKSNGAISVESNPVVISIKPDVVIVASSCDAETGKLVLSGDGFGDTPPEGAEQYLNIKMAGIQQEISSWEDEEIEASISSCEGTATLNALFGSVTYCVGVRLCASDSDNNGKVDLDDFMIIRTEYLRSDCAENHCQADANKDNKVDLDDLALMKVEYFREDCCQ